MLEPISHTIATLIKPVVDASNAVILPQQGDYEQNGLLYCGKCHTAKQIIIPDGGREIKVMCFCECAAEEEQRKEREYKARMFAEKVERMRGIAFSERRMRFWTFENDDLADKRTTSIARHYVDNFSEMRNRGKGLLLYGNVGTGKTYAACEIANALLDKGIPCIVTNFARITNTLQGLHEGRQDYIDDFSKYSLLVIDDLGAERRSEYMQEMVFNIIDSRYRAGLPMIITTNLPISEIKTPPSDSYSRIYDRIIEVCFPVEVSGRSRRRAKVRDEFDEIKSLLGLEGEK